MIEGISSIEQFHRYLAFEIDTESRRSIFPPIDSDNGAMLRIFQNRDFEQVYIEVRDDATTDSLKRAIPDALAWKRKLIELRGFIDRRGGVPLRSAFIFLRENDAEPWSYGLIARLLNQRVDECIRLYERFRVQVPDAPRDDDQDIDWIASDSVRFDGFYAAISCNTLLEKLGVKRLERHRILKEGASSLIRGTEPSHYFNRYKVREILRNFKNGKDHQALVPHPPGSEACLAAVTRYLHNDPRVPG